MSVSAYKYKFRINVSHSINSSTETTKPHSHTLEIALLMKQETSEFIGYEELEKKVHQYLSMYKGMYLNDIEPFNIIEPTIENIGNEFYEKIKQILVVNDFSLLKLDISETPTRIFSVSDTSVLGLLNGEANMLIIEDVLTENKFINSYKMQMKKDKNIPKYNLSKEGDNDVFVINQNYVENTETSVNLEIDSHTSERNVKNKEKIYTYMKVLIACIYFLACSYGIMIYIKRSGLYPKGSDIYGHIFKANFLYESIKNGDYYPLYTNLWYNGIQPFRYWAPVPYYILAALQFLVGGDPVNAYIVFVGLSFFIGASGWLLFGIHNKRMSLCITLGTLWFLLPDNMRVFFSEGNFPRMVITMLLPCLFYFIWSFIEYKNKRSIFFIIIIMSNIILCHVMIAAMIGIASFIFVIIYCTINKSYKESAFLIVSMLLCFAMVGIWLYPALKGGLMGMESSSTSEVMRSMSAKASISLNPTLRLQGGIETYYYGLSVLLISILGLLLSNRKSIAGFLSALIIFVGTTTFAYPLLSKLPLNQLLWMSRFTPIAYAVFFLALLEWKRCRKIFMTFFIVMLVADIIPSLRLVQYPISEKMANTYERQKKIADEYSFSYAKSITNQRLSLMDLSQSGSFPSYEITSREPRTKYVYGWAWQGASTSRNIVMLNTALEKGYYNYLFDRSIEMGSDTVIIRKELFQDPEEELKKINKSANLLGFNLVQDGKYSFVYNKQTPKTFGVITEYEGLAIGNSARQISFLFPSFKEADNDNLDEYNFESLKKYKMIYLSGFKYKNQAKAESLVRKLTEQGIKVYIDMNKIPVNSTTNRMTFLGVTAQEVSFSGRYPDIIYNNKFIQSASFGAEFSKWNTVYLENVPHIEAYSKLSNETLGVIGTGDNNNLVFMGFNFLYHSIETKDQNIVGLLRDVFGTREEILPNREIIPIEVQYEKNKIIVSSPLDNLNTTIAYQDNFNADREIANEQNLLMVNKGTTKIEIRYPYLPIGIVVSFFGTFSIGAFLYFILSKSFKST
ncbi:6-pyruvoyl-tetrahydropterin synthase-related protein [Inconstantimicrobium mannanitabidum]|uniref:6-pyruvoyl tetrahydrobiopterin synthase n=1 Tax=Inconstantimicrobium mannanitabidum TaxID=1604901 RepID=A0ACB5RFQ0_9CLOT|nr:6-pyruvoyl-tetrahydropterin synthase-related protein [Clostridium sp. TW13]GKX67917.1 6-pyruvoyl tetrahydrobiopterin synthase [Clostridium sp. TW13]